MATVLSRSFETVYRYQDTVPTQGDAADLFSRIASGCKVIARLFNIICEIVLFLTLVSLIRSIRIAHSPEDKNPLRHKWSRYLAYFIAFALTILELAVFSIGLYSIVSEVFEGSRNSAWDAYHTTTYTYYGVIIDGASQAIITFIAWAVLVRASVMRRRLRAVKRLHRPMRYMLVCCSLWTLRACYEIYAIFFAGFYIGPLNPSMSVTSSFNEALDVFFVAWTTFIILVILYYLGIDKKQGLWSAGRPLLTHDAESQAFSSESLAPEESASTPMTERAETPPLVPAVQHTQNRQMTQTPTQSDSLFACDGLVDAPPEYSPPAAQQGVASSTAAPLATLPALLQRTDRPSEDQSHHQGQASASTDNIVSTAQQGYDEAMPGNDATARHSRQDLHTEAAEPTASFLPTHDEAMGLYHQADGRAPASSNTFSEEAMGLYHQADGRQPQPTNVLPGDEEAAGLYHQADGRHPLSTHGEAKGAHHQADGQPSQSSATLPIHDEMMGLYHQADGRPPRTSLALAAEGSSSAVMYQSGADGEPRTSPPPHDEAMGLNYQADGRVPESEVVPYPEEKTDKPEKN